MTREFVFERATKNMLRFSEVVVADGGGEMSGTIYVNKLIFDKQPARIRVTVEEVTAS